MCLGVSGAAKKVVPSSERYLEPHPLRPLSLCPCLLHLMLSGPLPVCRLADVWVLMWPAVGWCEVSVDSGTDVLGRAALASSSCLLIPLLTLTSFYVLKKGSAMICHINSLFLGDEPPDRLGSKNSLDGWSRFRGLLETVIR